MDNIYIDTNILIDLFSKREPFVKDSKAFFDIGLSKYRLYTNSLSAHISVYVTKANTDDKKIIAETLSKLTVLPLTDEIITKAFDIDISDYEDILHFISASKHCRTIVTRDPKDFKKLAKKSRKKIEVLSPKQWLAKYA
jgi:predicted nucleic acid-binding protein